MIIAMKYVRHMGWIAVMMLFVLPSFVPVFAQTTPTKPGWIPCDGPECTFADLVSGTQAFATELVKIGLIVSPLILAYVGYLLVTSGDNPKNRTDAKKIGWNVVIGLAYMMLAWVVVNLILTALVCGVNNGNWFSVTACKP